MKLLLTDDFNGLVAYKIPMYKGMDIFKWATIVHFYPLPESKEKLLKKDPRNASKVMGILSRHLMSVARKTDVPQVYIKEVSRAKYWADYFSTLPPDRKVQHRNDMIVLTNKLLDAVIERIRVIHGNGEKIEYGFQKVESE